MLVDARGLACPMPVVMAKKQLDAGCKELVVAVDNETAVKNLEKLAGSKGITANVSKEDGAFYVSFGAAGAEKVKLENAAPAECGCGYAVFIGKDYLGEGERELGHNLIKMALYTLAQSDSTPASVLFMNSGVKLPAGDEAQVIESIKQLEANGASVLVCGTCLNYYGLTERLKAGNVSNMYDIIGAMQRAAKVITL